MRNLLPLMWPNANTERLRFCGCPTFRSLKGGFFFSLLSFPNVFPKRAAGGRPCSSGVGCGLCSRDLRPFFDLVAEPSQRRACHSEAAAARAICAPCRVPHLSQSERWVLFEFS
jgi:hypothetical protein